VPKGYVLFFVLFLLQNYSSIVKVLLFVLLSLPALAQQLSPQAKVSLLTISPGSELYSTFGHSAIRISDPSSGLDVNYNYGAFDFNAPGFYLKFLRGYLDYMISSHPAYLELDYWNRENRLITEQELRLSPAQKERIYAYLETNLRPENRTYRYKFFTDNCSTRLRDVLMVGVGDSLKLDTTLNTQLTYRDWIHAYAHTNGKPWADFGMDLAIGAGSDVATGWSDAMFIPDNLMMSMDSAQILTDEGFKSLVVSKRELNQIQPLASSGFAMSPTVLFGLFFVLVFFLNKAGVGLGFDRWFFGILGFGGWILMLLWFATDHGVTRYNWNILWLSPLLLPAAAYLGRAGWAGKVFLLYSIGLLIFVVVALMYWGLNLQNGLFFFIAAIGLRLFNNRKYFGLTRN
jgi:hypothetical protein